LSLDHWDGCYTSMLTIRPRVCVSRKPLE